MYSPQYVKKFLIVIFLVPVVLRGEGAPREKNSLTRTSQQESPQEIIPAAEQDSQEITPSAEQDSQEIIPAVEQEYLKEGVIGAMPAALPGDSYRPYLWIDCQKKGGVFEKKCFTQIKLVTTRMLESGEFAGVRSLSHLTWLYPQKKRISVVSFAEFPPYYHPEMSAFAKRVHHSDLVQLADEDGRYALIWVNYHPGRSAADVRRKNHIEWREMLNLYQLQSSFAHDPDFSKQMRGFYPYLAVLRIEGVKMNPDDPAFWQFFYQLERLLYKIKGVKRLYSPRHTLRSLSLSSSIETKEKDNLARLLSIWELTGEYGSLRLDPLQRRYDIAIFGLSRESLFKEVAAVSAKFLQSSGARWEIVPAAGILSSE